MDGIDNNNDLIAFPLSGYSMCNIDIDDVRHFWSWEYDINVY